MRDVFIFDAVRTPRGRAGKGKLAGVKPIDLAVCVLEALAERTRLDPERVADVIFGCVTQTGGQGANIAKTAALYAGWPHSVSGATINRFCSSGLDALNYAALTVASGANDLVVCGGVESMSQVPMFSDQGPWFADPDVASATGFVHMGVAADLVANLEGIERDELDAYAATSQQRASSSRDSGRFAGSIAAVAGLEHDEAIRDETTIESLAALEPLFVGPAMEGFREVAQERLGRALEARHTAGTSPAIVDAAAAMLVGSAEAGNSLGLEPRARFVGAASAAVDPIVMLTGNVQATQRVLDAAGIAAKDVDQFEINESFAVVPLHFARELSVDRERLNPCGGAIAMGHPLGATGAILVATLVDELERTGGTLGVAAICGGGGTSTSVLVSR